MRAEFFVYDLAAKVTRLLLGLALPLLLGTRVAAYDSNRFYFGHMYVFERAETHATIHGGRVTLLTPGGIDEFHDGEAAVLIEGRISAETFSTVKRLLERPEVAVVFLDSPGGELAAGIALGKLFRTKGIATIVNGGVFEWQRAQCTSACALAFLGGTRRIILSDPEHFGFHRQYRVEDGRIRYGDPERDRKAIQDYLAFVGADGITADEVVGTTGLMTFSARSLEDRRVITITKDGLRTAFEEIVRATGYSGYEFLRAACSTLGDMESEVFGQRLGSLPDSLLIVFASCAPHVPAFREPLVRFVLTPELRSLSPRELGAHLSNIEDDESRRMLNTRLSVPSYPQYLARRLRMKELRGF